MDLEQGDIVLALFPFDERQEKKSRPAMVWEAGGLFVKLIYISSQKADKAFPHEVVLDGKDAEACGLTLKSRIDFSKLRWIPKADVYRKLGSLKSVSIKKLRESAKAAEAAGLLA